MYHVLLKQKETRLWEVRVFLDLAVRQMVSATAFLSQTKTHKYPKTTWVRMPRHLMSSKGVWSWAALAKENKHSALGFIIAGVTQCYWQSWVPPGRWGADSEVEIIILCPTWHKWYENNHALSHQWLGSWQEWGSQKRAGNVGDKCRGNMREPKPD